MVNCVIKGCKNRWKKNSTVRFFTIPALKKRECEKTKAFSEERRLLWIDRINIKDLKITRATCVCSKHFKTGEPAALFDNLNPDWAPTLFLSHDDSHLSSPPASGKGEEEENEEKDNQIDEGNIAAEDGMPIRDTDKRDMEVEEINAEVMSQDSVIVGQEFSRLSRNYCGVKNELREVPGDKENRRTAYKPLLDNNVFPNEEIKKIVNENAFLKSENEKLVNINIKLKEDNEKVTSENKSLKIENETVQVSYQRVLNNNVVLTNEIKKVLNDVALLKLENAKLSNVPGYLKERNLELINENEVLGKDQVLLMNDYEKLKDMDDELKINYDKVVDENVKLKKDYETAVNVK